MGLISEWLEKDEEQYRQIMILCVGIAILLLNVTLTGSMVNLLLRGEIFVIYQMSMATLAICLLIAFLVWKYREFQNNKRRKRRAAQ